MHFIVRAACVAALRGVVSPAMAQTPAATAPHAVAAPAHPAATGFPTEAAAKAACGTDTVMWGNPSSKALHATGTRYYGKTKHGSYMCEQQATAAGYHTLKTDK